MEGGVVVVVVVGNQRRRGGPGPRRPPKVTARCAGSLGQPRPPPSRPLGASWPPHPPHGRRRGKWRWRGSFRQSPSPPEEGCSPGEDGGVLAPFCTRPEPGHEEPSPRALSAILQISWPSPGNGSRRPPATWSSCRSMRRPALRCSMELAAASTSEPSGPSPQRCPPQVLPPWGCPHGDAMASSWPSVVASMRHISCMKALHEGRGSVSLEVSQVARRFPAVSWLYVVRDLFHQISVQV
nr:basic proline-rich protein-like [Anser cygnoides]